MHSQKKSLDGKRNIPISKHYEKLWIYNKVGKGMGALYYNWLVACKWEYQWNIHFHYPCKQLSWNIGFFGVRAKTEMLGACKCSDCKFTLYFMSSTDLCFWLAPRFQF